MVLNSFEDFFIWLCNSDSEWSIQLSACTLEAIWKCRNELIFSGKSPSTPITLKHISSRALEFSQYLTWNEDAATIDDNRLPTSEMYAADCVDACYFVDASVLRSNAGIGVIMYRSGGGEAHKIQSFCTVSSVLEAELLAILTALEHAWKENFHSIIIHSDSKIAVEALRLGELPLAWGSYPVFKKCLKFSAMLSVACVFVNRELNSLADQLAHQARVDHFSLSSVV